MKWTEVSIITTHEATDISAEAFRDVGAQGVVIEDPALVNDYIRAGMWDYEDMPEVEDTGSVTVKAYLPLDDKMPARLERFRTEVDRISIIEKGSCEISCKDVADEDWNENWKQYFHTEKVGQHIVIKPSWEDYTAGSDDIVIELDPGAAFGTGTHPTTSMCIRALEELVRPGMTTFDVGTGSGVLAIAEAKLGAGRVVAKDYDPNAVRIAEENICMNHTEDVIETGVSDLLAGFDGRGDIISANLIADLVIRLFDDVSDYLAPGGVLLASGIIEERIKDVTDKAAEKGFSVDSIDELKGWAAIRFRLGTKP